MRQENHLHIEGIEQPISLRANPRARRLTLRISHAKQQAILTLPPNTPINDAKRFISSHIDWLKKQLDKIPDNIPFAHNQEIPLRGEPHLLNFVEGRSRGGVVSIDRDTDPATLTVRGAREHAPRRLTDWLKKEARIDLEDCVTYHATNLNLMPKKISVRDQTSRWGSCSSTGALSFSWRLVLAPPFILDYVAAHEVAHLAEMNHGPRFWKLVKQTMPEMEEAQSWLKRNGGELHRYGAR